MKRHITGLYRIMLIMGVLGVLDSLAVSIYAGVNTGNIFPGLVGIILILYSLTRHFITKGEAVIKNRLLSIFFITGIALFTVSFIIVEGLIIFNNHSQDKYDSDFLVILGAGVKNGKVTKTLQERLDKGLEYIKLNPKVKVIVSGGKDFGETITEAEAMKKYLTDRGADSSQIIVEKNATSTMENFKYTRELITGMGYTGKIRIMIITNDFHMMRSKMLARRYNFEPLGITCNTPLPVIVNCYIREYFAVIKSYSIDRFLSRVQTS